ncbi:predicted protein [Plenodomus lingam JN3]|uniref:Predicted protein n=1 Tax=Leptosphaeria maculans (strain JN3 / isolate v23.1.3 / race Av1-4-5-6-7-8) TaxID=985895 RepID=E5R476_LEPMJ|nr:predicted protein [Plenodomus lingam JN3]CBX91844.1 predicted protein [Plenodomus lingam JN3]
MYLQAWDLTTRRPAAMRRRSCTSRKCSIVLYYTWPW